MAQLFFFDSCVFLFRHHVVAKLVFLMLHVANFWQKARLFNKTVEFKAKTRTRVWKNVRFAWGFCKLCAQSLPCCGVVASGVPAFLGVVWFGKTVDKTPLLIYTLGAKSKSILLFGAKICPCKCVLAHVLSALANIIQQHTANFALQQSLLKRRKT